MKTLGLIGGSTWLSSADYYRRLNEAVRARRGGVASAPCLMYSFDFTVLKARIDAADWDGLEALLADAGERLCAAGAEALVLCANTLHAVAGSLARRLPLPLIHIADAAAQPLRERGIDRVGLLGTRPTMEMDFFRARFAAHGIDTMVPPAAERAWMHAGIFGELARGHFTDGARRRYLQIIEELAAEGAGAVVLACTEIPLLLADVAPVLPCIDTLASHVDAAVAFALDDDR